MAKTRGSNGKEKKARRKSFFSDERFRLSVGIFILLFSVFLLLSFLSYFFTWKIDQSFDWTKTVSDPSFEVDNWAGKMGAFLSNLFISKWFGVPSIIFPFLFSLFAFRMLGIKLFPLGKSLRISLIAVVLLSVGLGYLFADANGFLGSGPGGAHGYYISRWLNAFAGKTGTAFLLLVSVFAFILFSFHKSTEYIKSLWWNLFTKKTGENIQAEHEFKPEMDQMTEETIELIEEDEQEEETEKEIEEKEIDMNGNNDVPLTVRAIKGAGETLDEENWIHPDLETDYDPTLDLPDYKFPPLSLLEEYKSADSLVSKEELIANKNKIVETLANYKIQIDKITATIGPTVTLYEIIPAPGVRISKIKNLEDDIALSLAALGIRIIAPIPGRGTIGIEVPNQNPEIVSMRSIISSVKFQEMKYELPIGLGKTISNETYVVDLTKMPHLLVAGATGQGKSVGLNAIITSLLYKKHPAQLKFVLIDPKKVELTVYSKIERHYLAKLPNENEDAIITDTQKVIHTLNSLTIEMDDRYDLLKEAHVRNIKEYNAKFISRKLNPYKGHRYLPYIVVVIDEFADLILTAGREIETPLSRLAQLARAIGIHLVIATQRPTTNIITGVIKANFPTRVAFRVTSMMDSRTILDTPGANQLVGRGDMLISSGNDLIRLQCAFIDTPEIDRISEFIGSQRGYPSAHLLPEYVEESQGDFSEVDLKKKDEMFEEAARLVVQYQQGSTSLLQRKFSIGYNRAGRIIDQLEAAGVVGPFEGSKARQVLIHDETSLEQLLSTFNKD